MEDQNPIYFHRTGGDYGFLSNFYPSPIYEENKRYPTSEHYFQSKKFNDQRVQEQIRQAQSPFKAASLGRSRQFRLRSDWEEVKYEIMLEAVRLKFNQHRQLGQQLRETGQRPLIERTDKDSFWGDGPEGNGLNMLGKILMIVRSETLQFFNLKFISQNIKQMETLRRAAQQFKDKITKTPLERELIEVTNNDNWAVPSTKLQELAERTNNFDESRVIMRHVWETLKADTKDWRKIYKAMNLIEVILKFGSNSCSQEIRDNVFKIRMLKDFSHREEGQERGSGIRDKSVYLTELLTDYKRLDEERRQAQELRNKFRGFSSNDYRGSGYSNSYNHRSWESSYGGGGNDYNEWESGRYDPGPQQEQRGWESGRYEQSGSSSDIYNSPKPSLYGAQKINTEPSQPKQNSDIFKAPQFSIKPVQASQEPPKRIQPPPGGIFSAPQMQQKQPVQNNLIEPIQQPAAFQQPAKAEFQPAAQINFNSAPQVEFQPSAQINFNSAPQVEFQPATKVDFQSVPDFQITSQTNFQNAPQTNSQSAPQTNSQSIPQANFQSAPQTNFQSTPQTNFQSAPPVQFSAQIEFQNPAPTQTVPHATNNIIPNLNELYNQPTPQPSSQFKPNIPDINQMFPTQPVQLNTQQNVYQGMVPQQGFIQQQNLQQAPPTINPTARISHNMDMNTQFTLPYAQQQQTQQEKQNGPKTVQELEATLINLDNLQISQNV